jgi:uncharacterized membrane protein
MTRSFNILRMFRDFFAQLAEHRSFRVLLVVAIFGMGFGIRIVKAYFAKPSDLDFSDLDTLQQGAMMGLEGKNIYAITLQTWSFQHFFAYPAGTYWLSVLILKTSIATGISYLHAAQLIGFSFDMSIAALIFVILRTEQFYSRVLAVLLALFNPFMFSNTLANVKPDDALMLTAVLAALFSVGLKRFRLGSFLYGFSLTTKQFPILLFPYFIYHLPKKIRKNCIVALVGGFMLFSLPFILSDPISYLKASYLLHVSRASEGSFGANAFSGLTVFWQNPLTQALGLAILVGVVGLIYMQFLESDPYTFAFLLAFSFISFYWVIYSQYFSYFVPFLIVSITKRIQTKSSQRN